MADGSGRRRLPLPVGSSARAGSADAGGLDQRSPARGLSKLRTGLEQGHARLGNGYRTGIPDVRPKSQPGALTGLGVARTARYLEELTDHLCERLQSGQYQVVSSRKAGEKSQIVCIRSASGMSAMALYAHLKKRNIITAPRGDRLRIAPHLYNTHKEIEALVHALP